MSRSISIHLGVNHPGGTRRVHTPLTLSEAAAWQMATLANEAGYDSVQVLRGAEATLQGVHDALAGAARGLGPGDTLLLSYSGHGDQIRDLDGDEFDGFDETWCLHDGELLDDKLAGYWRLFAPGVRVVVVVESCYSGGAHRGEDDRPWRVDPNRRPLYRRAGIDVAPRREAGPAGRRWRGGAEVRYRATQVSQPAATDGIAASVLVLTASTEHQPAQEGLFTQRLMGLWNGGAFTQSYADLHEQLSRLVTRDRNTQEPQILMLGTPDPEFPLLPAFHVRPAPPSSHPSSSSSAGPAPDGRRYRDGR